MRRVGRETVVLGLVAESERLSGQRRARRIRTLGLAIAAALVVTSSTFGQPRVSELRPAGPVNCDANQNIVIKERRIEGPEAGISAKGNCVVVLIDSHVTGGEYGIRASGNANVRIQNSIVEGADAALRASGNAEIRYASSVITGEKKASGNASVLDRGDRDLTAGTRASGAVVSPGNINLGGIKIDENGIRMPGVEIGPDGVRAGSAGVRVGSDGSVVVGAPGASVVVDGDWVRIQSGGAVVEVDEGWRVGGPRYSQAQTEQILVELGAKEVDGAMQLALAGDVLFDFDSATVKQEAAAELAKVAHVIRKRSKGQVEIIGHTDSVGDDAYNQKLSEKRALAVMQWLGSEESVPLQLMRGQGLGETAPVAHNTTPGGDDNPSGRAKNRRVEIRFSN